MVRDPGQLREHWGRAAHTVAEKLGQGLDVAFATLGDPLLYSTYNYLLKALAERDPRIQVETVPGVTSFAAAAALANLPLVERDEAMAVLPASVGVDTLKLALTEFDTVVLMKIGHRLARVRGLLQEMGLAQDAVMVSRAGLEGQVIARDISQVEDERSGYLSVVIVRRRKEDEG
jgi:precorrin-2/cobalt-factor-2 C20-methyltransferase